MSYDKMLTYNILQPWISIFEWLIFYHFLVHWETCSTKKKKCHWNSTVRLETLNSTWACLPPGSPKKPSTWWWWQWKCLKEVEVRHVWHNHGTISEVFHACSCNFPQGDYEMIIFTFVDFGFQILQICYMSTSSKAMFAWRQLPVIVWHWHTQVPFNFLVYICGNLWQCDKLFDVQKRFYSLPVSTECIHFLLVVSYWLRPYGNNSTGVLVALFDLQAPEAHWWKSPQVIGSWWDISEFHTLPNERFYIDWFTTHLQRHVL